MSKILNLTNRIINSFTSQQKSSVKYVNIHVPNLENKIKISVYFAVYQILIQILSLKFK